MLHHPQTCAFELANTQERSFVFKKQCSEVTPSGMLSTTQIVFHTIDSILTENKTQRAQLPISILTEAIVHSFFLLDLHDLSNRTK